MHPQYIRTPDPELCGLTGSLASSHCILHLLHNGQTNLPRSEYIHILLLTQVPHTCSSIHLEDVLPNPSRCLTLLAPLLQLFSLFHSSEILSWTPTQSILLYLGSLFITLLKILIYMYFTYLLTFSFTRQSGLELSLNHC